MIHLFCALACEAKPLINHFDLQLAQDTDSFKIYSANDKKISLTITGVGKTNSAAAISHHAEYYKPLQSDIWLNIGIAGHEQAELGECYLVNKITDFSDQQHWYPQFIIDMPCKSMPLITLDTPSNNYQASLYDMEASGFYSAATKLGTNELIHCIKIISDNNNHHFDNINAKKVDQYIKNNIPVIEKILSTLSPLAEELKKLNEVPKGFLEITELVHFTATEQIQLDRILKQWRLRLPDNHPIDHIQSNMKAKNVMETLAKMIEETPYTMTS